jgi:NTE family protein
MHAMLAREGIASEAPSAPAAKHAAAFNRASEGREDDDRFAAALRAHEPFRDLSPEALARLARVVTFRRVERGQALFRLGEPSESLFLVGSGRFHVVLDMSGNPVAEIGAGEPVGELAFLTGEARTATVVAARDSEVVEISRRSYELLLDCAPRLQRMLLVRLAERMRRMAPAARPLGRAPARTIALLTVGGAPLPDALVRELADALAELGRTEIVTVRDASDAEARLPRLERECRFVLAPVSEEQGEAAHRMLRHCDAVILVAQAGDGAGAPPRPLERAAADLFLKKDRSLVVWRGHASSPIAGTADWLRDRSVDLHHHVAFDDPASISRLARFIAGRAVGAVFGGGGALGCGHIGLVRAFRDAGLTFDLFGGTSAGAAMALAFATGISPEELMDRTEEIFVRKRALRRYTLPVFSFLDHTVFDRELAAHYGDRDMRDLPVNAYAVSTNLTRNAKHVHRSGPVWQAVRSSGAIPGALPPFATEDGDVLVDGALVDNLPVATMRELKLGPNVLAGFFEDDSRHYRISYSAVPSRARLFGDLLLRRRRSFPRLLNVLARAMLVTSRRSLRETEIGGDLMVRLPVCDRMGLLDWRRGRAQEEASYRHVSELIGRAGGPLALIASAGALQAH